MTTSANHVYHSKSRKYSPEFKRQFNELRELLEDVTIDVDLDQTDFFDQLNEEVCINDIRVEDGEIYLDLAVTRNVTVTMDALDLNHPCLDDDIRNEIKERKEQVLAACSLLDKKVAV